MAVSKLRPIVISARDAQSMLARAVSELATFDYTAREKENSNAAISGFEDTGERIETTKDTADLAKFFRIVDDVLSCVPIAQQHVRRAVKASESIVKRCNVIVDRPANTARSRSASARISNHHDGIGASVIERLCAKVRGYHVLLIPKNCSSDKREDHERHEQQYPAPTVQSVDTQVQRLISVATSEELLAEMFVGWLAWW